MAEANNERGSVLLLFPVGVIVLMMLAAIAVDLSAVHLARRELLRTTSQAVDDAAAMLDRNAVRQGDLRTIDHAAAERLIRFELATASLAGPLVGPPRIAFDDATGTVPVSVAMRAPRVFGRTVPGVGPDEVVEITTSGRLIAVG